jgi:osmotically-inducible protein OsmY
VLTRLRWDKGLAGTAVQVDTPGTGVVRLQGTVADDQQRRRAVDLAESTQGVEKVVDELTVGPAAESP